MNTFHNSINPDKSKPEYLQKGEFTVTEHFPLNNIKSNFQKFEPKTISRVSFAVYILISFCIFYTIIYTRIGTDLQLHIKLLKDHLSQASFPNPPLYYFFIYILDIVFPSDFKLSTVLVLTLASSFKYLLVEKYISKGNIQNDQFNFVKTFFVFSLMFLAPIILYPLDGTRWYLGKFTSTIWHNSTTILMFPIAILMFMKCLELLRSVDNRKLIFIFFLGVLLILSKPSFLFALIPTLPLLYIIKTRRINKGFFKIMAVMGLILALIFIQKSLIYDKSELDKVVYNGEESTVIVAPFKVWLYWANNPLLSIISSFALLAFIVSSNFKLMIKNIEFKFASLLLVASLGIYFSLAENGPRMFHANFFWQVPVAFLICYMVVIKIYLRYLRVTYANINSWHDINFKEYLIGAVYSMHFCSGLLYIVKLLVFKHYR